MKAHLKHKWQGTRQSTTLSVPWLIKQRMPLIKAVRKTSIGMLLPKADVACRNLFKHGALACSLECKCSIADVVTSQMMHLALPAAHQTRVSVSSSASGTTLLTRPMRYASCALYSLARNHISLARFCPAAAVT